MNELMRADASELVDIPIYHGDEPHGQPIGVLRLRRDAIPGGLAWDLQPSFRLVRRELWEVTHVSLNLRAVKPVRQVPALKIVRPALPVVDGELCD
jgi:hypothetical protein